MTKLDITHKRILTLLQDDAKLTTKEIADKTGKTLTPVYERIKWLEQEGYIKKYVALLDGSRLGKNLVAYTNVQLKEHSHSMLKSFEKAVVRLDEVMECYHMSGSYDYLLKIILNDMSGYQDFIMNKLAKLANIGTVQSSFMLTEVKQETAYVLR